MNMAPLILLLASAVMFGAMVFFSLVIAPLVHSRLPPEHASNFLRAAFPRYYLFNGVLAVVAVTAAWYHGWLVLVASMLLLAGFVVAGGYLMPAMNRLRERREQDAVAAEEFRLLHRRSMAVNLLQLTLLVLILVRLAGN